MNREKCVYKGLGVLKFLLSPLPLLAPTTKYKTLNKSKRGKRREWNMFDLIHPTQRKI